MTAHRTTLLRLLSSWEGAAVSLGVAIGAGIFRTPGEIAGFLPRPAAILGVWLLGGALVLLDALVLAELAAMRPAAGGHYAWLRDAYGPRWASMYGFSAAFLTWPASVAALAAVGADYAQRLSLNPTAVALFIILAPAALHATGLKSGALGQDALSYAKAGALGGLCLTAILLAPSAGPASGRDPLPAPQALTLVGLVLALQRVLWTYDGYADTVFVAEEVRDPGRAIPRALLASVGTLTLLYFIVNAAFLAWLTPAEMATSDLVAADVARALGGHKALRLVEGLALLTVFGGASATLLSGPRISYAMARDGLLFRGFTRVTARGTPIVALLVMTFLALVYWRLNTFDQIVEMTIFVIWTFVLMTTTALFVFRRREPHAPRPFRTPLYPLTPALLLASGVVFLGISLQSSPRAAVWGIAVMLAGLAVHDASAAIARRRAG